VGAVSAAFTISFAAITALSLLCWSVGEYGGQSLIAIFGIIPPYKKLIVFFPTFGVPRGDLSLKEVPSYLFPSLVAYTDPSKCSSI
jgi:hypothetical protein